MQTSTFPHYDSPVSLSRIWWLWIPFAFIAGQIIFEVLASETWKEIILQEGGIHESFQAMIALIGCVIGVRLLICVRSPWLKLWYFIAALGCFYIAGEEISWGQWIFHWTTPTEWARLNDQDETNLHNMSTWLDQKPQALLQIGVLVGGIIIPLIKHFAPHKLPQRFAPIYGDMILLPTALIALVLKIIDTLADMKLGISIFHFFWRISEVLELFIYYFVTLYLGGQWAKTRGNTSPCNG